MPEGGGPEKFSHDAATPKPSVNLRDAEMEWDQPAVAIPPKPPARKISPAQEKRTGKLGSSDTIVLSGFVNPKKRPDNEVTMTPQQWGGRPGGQQGWEAAPPSLLPKDEQRYTESQDYLERRRAWALEGNKPRFPGEVSPKLHIENKLQHADDIEDAVERGYLGDENDEKSRSVTRVTDDIYHILAERQGLDHPFTRKSADVFFRVEAMAIATQGSDRSVWKEDIAYGQDIRITRPEILTEKEIGNSEVGDYKTPIVTVRRGELVPSRAEYVEDDMMVDAEREFGLLVNDLKALQESGAAEDVVFKKLLEQVNAFPYRKTANSLLKAFAGRSREHQRPKHGLLHELAHANELPGLNCEGRAKMFAGLLEAIGYSPTEDIFINWPELHVQTLLKRKDGTWLAFEGSNRRPFIQTFTGATAGICTLQEWKHTMYGLPSAETIASIKPEVKIAEAAPDEAPAWQEGKFEKAMRDAVDAAKELASVSASSIVAAFAGSANEEERVKNAYPKFEENEHSQKQKMSGLEKAAVDVNSTVGGHAESARKILGPRIAAAKRLFGGKIGVVIAALAAGCWFSYGAAHESDDDNTPPSADEVKKERNDWEELAEASLHEVAVDTSLAPYVFGEFDLVFKTQEGTVEQKQEGGETVHTLKLADSVRTMSPDVFESMVKKDITAWAEGRSTTDSTWVIDGKNLDVHAAQRAITELPETSFFRVSDTTIRDDVLSDKRFSITWQFTGGEEDDQITLSFMADDGGPSSTRGAEFQNDRDWLYAMDSQDISALATIQKIEDRMLKTTYGMVGWKAPLAHDKLQ